MPTNRYKAMHYDTVITICTYTTALGNPSIHSLVTMEIRNNATCMKSISMLMVKGLDFCCMWYRWLSSKPQGLVQPSPYKVKNIVAAFRGMHVSPAKHSYAWLSRKCDYRTDRHTHSQTDAGHDYRTDRHTHTQTDAGQSDPYVPLCFAGDTKTRTPGGTDRSHEYNEHFC